MKTNLLTVLSVCVDLWLKTREALTEFQKMPSAKYIERWHNRWAGCITSQGEYSDEDNTDQVLGLCRRKFSPETIQAHHVPITSIQFTRRESVNDFTNRDVWSFSAVMESYMSCNNHAT
jgi:hypothetical protein